MLVDCDPILMLFLRAAAFNMSFSANKHSVASDPKKVGEQCEIDSCVQIIDILSEMSSDYWVLNAQFRDER